MQRTMRRGSMILVAAVAAILGCGLAPLGTFPVLAQDGTPATTASGGGRAGELLSATGHLGFASGPAMSVRSPWPRCCSRSTRRSG